MASFKKPSRNFRKRQQSSSSDEGDEVETVNAALEDTKEIQKLRKRQKGVNIEDLAVGQVKKKEEKDDADPLKLKTGGFMDLKTLKKQMKIASAEDVEQIGTSFAAETNRRDEDADMLKYVEEELRKRKGIEDEAEEEAKTAAQNPMDSLYELPEHIKNITSASKKSEDMLSNQMLSGIPEIDLGIDAKIKNIEVTEEAKQKLLDDRRKKKDSGLSFIPTNMAVNFMQHNRFSNTEDNRPKAKKEPPAPAPAPLRVGDVDRPDSLQDNMGRGKKSGGEKATDDFYYERFKKQTRKY